MRTNIRNRHDADHYDLYSSSQMGPWDELMVRRASDLLPDTTGEKVLIDVGTGTGVIPMLLARTEAFAEYKFIGFEFFTDMVERGRQRIAEEELADRIQIEIGDAHALPCETGSIDMLISRATLHHLENPAKALEDSVRVLKPGGVALIHDARRDAPEEILTAFNAMRAKVGYKPTTLDEKLTLAEAEALLEQTGLAELGHIASGEGVGALGYEIMLRKPQ